MSQVGDSISANNANWSFDGDIVENFESHIDRSVPLYKLGHELIIECADFFIKNDSICYELGCSTGLLSHKLSERFKSSNSKFIGLDEVENMIKFANKKYKNENLSFKIANVLDYEYQNADMIISYYLLQFIRPSNKQNLINKIYANLNWGGAFLCFEKVRSPDARFQDITTGLYHEYKLKNGYTNDQILNKTRSLKGILEPFSTKGNLDMFKRAGFKDITSIFKFVCFEGFLCIK
tara:strand:- start:1652 stop:2359 length:708 start_codon:yes stop_codon:yes gene_type:complete